METHEYGFKKTSAINYQIGNVEQKTADKIGLNDSKVMMSEERIYHAGLYPVW